MACQITIDDVVGVGPDGGPPTAIHIRGSAQGCLKNKVIVSVGCGPTAIIQPPYPLSTVVEVANDGTWHASFTDLTATTCTCGKVIRVKAVCEAIPACQAPPYQTILRCEDDEHTLPCTLRIDGIDLRDDGCNEDGTRNITLTANISGGTPLSYRWEFGDSAVEQYDNTRPNPETTTHAYPAPGTGTSSFTAVLTVAESLSCMDTYTKEVRVDGCDGTCPRIREIVVKPRHCVDTNHRLISLDADIDGGGVEQFVWEFGDGEQETINATIQSDPSTTHTYAAPGSYTVRLRIRGPQGCPEHSLTRAVVVESCRANDEEKGGGGTGGGGWCGLRYAIIVAMILAALALYVAVCVPGAAAWAAWAAAAFALAAAIMLGLWAKFCRKKPCKWGLLLAAEIALGSGFGALYFAVCCPDLWLIGGGLILLGLTLFALWIEKCKPTRCQIIKELAVLISVGILPVLDVLGVVPGMSACASPWVRAGVAVLSATLTALLVSCVNGEDS